ncbi:MAG: hypothetical protein KAI24_18705 [Planctomycetes bacterium]|nr:hypothetical protein [Planctomycetota bacterium]
MSQPDPRKGTHYQLSGTGFFVLIGSQRSGTNFFREVVNTNDEAVVHGEVLWPYPLPNVWHNYIRTMVSRALPAISPADGMALVDDYFVHLVDDTRRGHPQKADKLSMVGVDIKYNQLSFIAPLNRDLGKGPFLLDYLRERSVPIVHMTRRNLAKQALSLTIAEARNVYHNYAGTKFEGSIEIAPQRVVAFCNWVAHQRKLLREMTAGMSVHEVTYEDVAAACRAPADDGDIGGNDCMRGLAEFLGIASSFRNPTTIKKVINRPYREILSNYKAIRKALEASEFAEFADSID